MAYIFEFMNFENSSWYYMTYSSEIIGPAPGHWSVKLIQCSFIPKIILLFQVSFLPWFSDPFMLFLVKTQGK